MQDIFVPTSRVEDALVGPLHTVTYVTAEPDTVSLALTKGFQLRQTETLNCDDADDEGAGAGLSLRGVDSWQVCAYNGVGATANVQIRVVGVDGDQPRVRPDYMGLYLGGISVGFPIADLPDHERKMASLGFTTTVGVKELEFASPEGQTYVSAEVLYKAPENVLLLGVMRPDVFIPVGPVDDARGIGGPSYSARCVPDADAAAAFLEQVLGYEIRRDMDLPVGEDSPLLMPAGTHQRFVQAFSPGAASGYLVLMDHRLANRPSAAPPRPPNRGIVMWSFETASLEEVHRRARVLGANVIREPADGKSPFLPARRTLQVEDTSGFMFEFFER